jgi:hypothetical protein
MSEISKENGLIETGWLDKFKSKKYGFIDAELKKYFDRYFEIVEGGLNCIGEGEYEISLYDEDDYFMINFNVFVDNIYTDEPDESVGYRGSFEFRYEIKDAKIIISDDGDVVLRNLTNKEIEFIKKITDEQLAERVYDDAENLSRDCYEKGGRICPVGTEIQTLIFDQNMFSEKSAKSWAKKHDFKYGFVDDKTKTFRIRQQEPDYFKDDSFRTIKITNGIKAVIGCPK